MSHRISCCLFACLVGLTLSTFFLSAAGDATATTNLHCVNPTGTGCDPLFGPNCYGLLQEAVDVANNGDEIRVAGGIYTHPLGTVARIEEALTIRGGYNSSCSVSDPDMYATVLDALGAGSVITTYNAGTVHLLHLTLRGGDGKGNCMIGSSVGGCGGGIYALDTRLIVDNSVISGNVANSIGDGQGGGIDVDSTLGFASLQLINSQVINNHASDASTGWGGGLHMYPFGCNELSLIQGNHFEGNVGSTGGEGQGGGILVSSCALLFDNTFYDNYGTRGSTSTGYGGGLYLWYDSDGGIQISSNRFLHNNASEAGYGVGGAIYGSYQFVFTMTNNLLAMNQSNGLGGGVTMDSYYGSSIKGLLVNNTIAENGSGSGGEAVYVGKYVTLTLLNNILAYNAVGITNTKPATSLVLADHNLFNNSSDPLIGASALLTSPLFTEGYRISPASPAVDYGLTIPWLSHDLPGNLRPQGGRFDLGAFEVMAVYLPLVLR